MMVSNRVVEHVRLQNEAKSADLDAAGEDESKDASSVGQTLQGSFSAVSKPTFAREYAFESSRRDLHNALLSTVLFFIFVFSFF